MRRRRRRRRRKEARTPMRHATAAYAAGRAASFVGLDDSKAIPLADIPRKEAPAEGHPRTAPGELAMITEGPDIKVTYLCQRCKIPVNTLKARVASKQKQTFICGKCNCRGVQLHRRFGAWPPAAFASLGDEWQEQVWKDARNKTSGARLEEHVVDTITRQRVEKEETSVGGKYLPLSVYDKKGYDIKMIEAKCKDWEEHEILGRCYRVNV